MSYSNQVSFQEYQEQKITLLPILLAQQLVLLPLYFFIPKWIVVLNLFVAGIVYFGLIARNWQIPTWLKVVMTVIATAGVLMTFHRLAGRDAGVALISIMYGLKILEVQKRRDVYVLMLLGFFVLLAGFLFNQSPLIAIYQIIPIAAIFNALTSIHSLTKTSDIIARDFQASWKRQVKYLVLAIPIMVILFVFFPRLSGPIWKMPGGSKATSGLSDSMSPGAFSSLQLFEEIAFRVKFIGEVPNASEMYWRTMVFDDFDGLSWTLNETSSQILSETNLAKNEASQSAKFSYEISLEKTSQRWLTVLDKPISLPRVARLYNNYTAQVPYRITERLRYKAKSDIYQTIDKNKTKKQLKEFLQLPNEGNPDSRSWAVQERKKYPSDKEFILSILSTINQQEYFYSLNPPIMRRDTVDSFWLEERNGFCEHYAGALVFLARAASIPARVVVGYQGAEENTLSDYWIVRYANAHAWTEVWFEGEGWQRIDPTAAIAQHRIEEQLQTDYRQRDSLFDDFGFKALDIEDIGIFKQLEFWMDKANTNWNDWVLDYGRDKQLDLFKGLGLSKLNSTQILVLMIFSVGLFLLWVSVSWLKNKPRVDLLEGALRSLFLKLAKQDILVADNQGINSLIINLNGNNKIDFQSKKQIVELCNQYLLLRYNSNTCTDKQQKDFLNKVKALKIRSH